MKTLINFVKDESGATAIEYGLIAALVAVGLIDFNDPVREFHVERCKRYIDLARTWKAKNILLVLGEYIWQREVIPAEAQWNWAIETCRRLGDQQRHAAKELEAVLQIIRGLDREPPHQRSTPRHDGEVRPDADRVIRVLGVSESRSQSSEDQR